MNLMSLKIILSIPCPLNLFDCITFSLSPINKPPVAKQSIALAIHTDNISCSKELNEARLFLSKLAIIPKLLLSLESNIQHYFSFEHHFLTNHLLFLHFHEQKN